jgi:dTDP-glucose 4,6-dehydratase
VYNIGGGHEVSNLELAEAIADLACAPLSLVSFVPDRPGHDFRYDLAWDRLRALGWKPEIGFEEGLDETVAWFRHRLAAEAEAVRK